MTQPPLSVDARGRYWLTPAGIKLLLEAEKCTCRPIIENGWIRCPTCGTIFGHLSQLQLPGAPGVKRRTD